MKFKVGQLIKVIDWETLQYQNDNRLKPNYFYNHQYLKEVAGRIYAIKEINGNKIYLNTKYEIFRGGERIKLNKDLVYLYEDELEYIGHRISIDESLFEL